MEELYRLGLIRSTSPALNFTVKTGMVSRVFYDEKGKITGHEVVDKFGQSHHYSLRGVSFRRIRGLLR